MSDLYGNPVRVKVAIASRDLRIGSGVTLTGIRADAARLCEILRHVDEFDGIRAMVIGERNWFFMRLNGSVGSHG